MGAVSSFLKPLKENIKYRLRWRYLWKDWFLGRHACLGYDVLKHFENLPTEVNFQKGRADLLVRYLEEKKLLPKAGELAKFMARKDVLPLIKQLEYFDCLPKHPPKFILMDSFSELTDQLFEHKFEGWQFACGFSDINHSEDFGFIYNAWGLLSIIDIQKSYEDLFKLIEIRWGKVPIYFLHFPIALEKRDIFRERYFAIMSTIDSLSANYSHIHSIKIDESRVISPSNVSDALKDFPYHYDYQTYAEFARLMDLNQFALNRI
ncbi:hypothetical protein [Polynucleobacter sp. AP-Feld-500C-C5]|uniref:hypothetical protein n=1 Tax=Polynucleobacter sp. AP-Feld-500C-C5 TaxID=2576924 RepID=UPI001C0DD71C|nr:hypothetical protein [Polynucleobacter sp. AP-Feld-500C-C5]MBU3632849.1 hypothetical protein [Polynucleobacter sp. AP-Feld-500C-C5]